MRRAPLALLGLALSVIVVGCAVLAAHITDYVNSPLAISSTSGLSVFTGPDGELGAYDFFEPGVGPDIITAGGVLLFAALFLLTVLWRRHANGR